MDFRSALDQVKQFFVIGKNNPYLHGRQQGEAAQAYDPQEAYQPPQQTYAPNYAQQQPQMNYQGYQQPAYQPPQADPYAPQQAAYQQPAPQAYQAPYQAPPQPSAPAQFQSQFNPEPYAQGGRNRRSQQHQEPQYQAPYQAPYQQPVAQAPENLVQFPGTQAAESKMVDAYVINVFNINSCRQAMTCLRRGQCTLIVMDQLIDKSEIRRYVDMLTGACYALGGTMTRLSAKIGFYIMAPSGMTVYTDPTTSNANAQPRPQQAPVYRAPQAQPQQPQASAFTANSGYGAVPQMSFSAHQPQPGQVTEPEPQAPAYQGYEEYAQQRYQAQ